MHSGFMAEKQTQTSCKIVVIVTCSVKMDIFANECFITKQHVNQNTFLLPYVICLRCG